jgi:uncharacterized protein (DUF1697 family)
MAMNTWIALFRGINVGGNNILPMKELRALLKGLACAEVETYIQSGNVVFGHSADDADQLTRSIGKAVLESHGFEPKVLLLTIEQLEEAVRSNPFTEAEAEPKTLSVFFLAEQPLSPAIDIMDDIKTDSEGFSLVDTTFYLHAPDGFGRSKLAAKAEKLLGVAATARNWRTVMKVLEMARHQSTSSA